MDRVVTLHGSADLDDRVVQLHQVTRAYHRFAYFDRVSYTNLKDLARNYRNFTGLVSFRPFSREDLQELTHWDRRVPSGVTRCPSAQAGPPLQHPAGDAPSAGSPWRRRRTWLQETILEKVADKAIRFYREPTFFFDE